MLINFLSVRRVSVKVRGVIVGGMNKIWILHLAKRQTVKTFNSSFRSTEHFRFKLKANNRENEYICKWIASYCIYSAYLFFRP